MKKYFITAKQPTTLEKLCKKHLPEQLNISEIIGSGGVWLDKVRILNSAHLIQKGQTVLVLASPSQSKKYVLPEDRIVLETRTFLVVNKPPGLSTVSDRTALHDNLTYGVQTYLHNKGLRYSPVAITRLDFEVQGLVIFSKSKSTEKILFHLSQTRALAKQYVAVLPEGDYPKFVRVREPLGFTHRAVIDPNGKPSETVFVNKGSYWSIFPKTGRRHQIRCHAAFGLAPIIGDTKYGAKPGEKKDILLAAVGYNFSVSGTRYRIRLPKTSLTFTL